MANGDNPPANPFGALGLVLPVSPEAAVNNGKATKSQQGAEAVQRGLHNNGTDPAYIKDLEDWDSVPHQAIYDSVQSMNPDTIHGNARKWLDISAAVGGALFGLNLSIQKELSDGFHGQFANAANDAARKFVQQGTDAQEVMQTVGARIHAAGYGAEAVRASVPPPGKPHNQGLTTPVTSLWPLVGAEDPALGNAAQRDAEEARQQAITAMKMNYNPTYQPAGQNVPTFVPVDSPGEGGPGGLNGNGNGTGTGTGTGTGSPNSSNGTDQKATNPDDKANTDNQQTDPSTSPNSSDSSNSGGNQGSSSASGTTGGADTKPAGLDSSTSPAGVGSGSGSHGGTSGGLGGIGSGGVGGIGGGGANAPGRSMPGLGGAGNAAAAAALAGRGGAAGAAGMPGMGMPHGGKGKGEEDSEHKTPDYLIIDREEELFGIRERTTPQAIGADIPAAQTRPDDGEGQRR
ncbi:hypothetical protein [Nocardia pseudobrasiliensis]|uniref:PPE family protein n=1 Tax=Nocardia pseudobrasiliensis TaxID=45979 RepID=A0A370I0R8_9NOCA|nr:hypothetical protein [Nocardia pseudobrasiliensis]RDI64353.1 hypothetical protein DFR76_108185 [Nocardia pseudobrasiliensis]